MVAGSASSRPTEAVQKGSSDGVAIRLENLSKTYGKTPSVTDLTLDIREGEIFGYLGPNGAGKTTTIRMMLNLIKPTSGRAIINGLDSQRDSVAIKRQLGYLPGEFSLYPNLTGAQTLQYFANLRGGVEWKYIAELAERLELDLQKRFRQYSRGNKQKVGIIQAVMHRPRLLVLDEPTGGLDPLNQQEFYKLVHEMRQAGQTVFFSSHIIGEVEKICDRVGIIRQGRLVRLSQISELVELKTHQLELTFTENVPLAEFEELPGVEKVELTTNGGHPGLRVLARPDGIDGVVKTAARHQLMNLVSHEPSLEEIFLHYYETPVAV